MVAILIVDDDPDIRTLLRIACSEEGWDVLEAENGLVGLRLLETTTQPRVVVLDYRMPGMDGLALLQAATRDRALLRRHAFLLLTANPTSLPPDLYTLARELRIPIIAKPFDLDEMIDAIERASHHLGRPSYGMMRAAQPIAPHVLADVGVGVGRPL